jgi:hypothetical protein
MLLFLNDKENTGRRSLRPNTIKFFANYEDGRDARPTAESRTRQQLNGVLENLQCKPAATGRTGYQDRHARNHHRGPEKTSSNQRPDTFTQTVLRPENSSCSQAADHTFAPIRTNRVMQVLGFRRPAAEKFENRLLGPTTNSS